MDKIRYILASASPRRKKLIARLIDEFEVIPSKIAEITDSAVDPRDLVMNNALMKATDIAARYPEAVVIGADTLVVLEGAIIGKPADMADAVRMLTDLSGRTHQVFTGIAMTQKKLGIRMVDFDCSEVTFKSLGRTDIERYVNEKKPLDMAGGYGIQDVYDSFIDYLEGDINNVMGLPINLTAKMLDEINEGYISCMSKV